jgi:hypothetical protein
MPWFDSGHIIIGHAIIAGSHVTSHWHEFVHAIVPQAIGSLQVASQRPVPQSMFPHAAMPPPHVTSHRPEAQVTGPHAFAPVHVATRSPVVTLT